MSLLAVLAHPDDESMGTGGLLSRHAAAGVDVHLVCATRGGAGWQGKPPGATPEDLPRIRTAELEAAASVLGLAGVHLWDYPDGGVEQSDLSELSRRIAEVVRTLAPAAVIGWGPDGGYGHPDHIAVGRCTDAAVGSLPEGERPALYHLALDEALAEAYHDMMDLVGAGDGMALVVQPDVGPIVDLTPEEVQVKVKAIDCHQSQVEDWRVMVKGAPDLLRRVYAHEPYLPVSSGARLLGSRGLLAEF